MSQSAVSAVSDALLYEGYLLYPYRKSAIKNQLRWTFGCLYPQDWCEQHDPSDKSSLRSEFSICGGPATTFDVCLRCLNLAPDASDGQPATVESDTLIAGIEIKHLMDAPENHPFELMTARSDIPSEEITPISGCIRLQAAAVGDNSIRIAIEVHNETEVDTSQMDRDASLRHTLISTHLLLTCHQGAFISLTDPPDALRNLAQSCRNNGYWPVLLGTPGSHSQLLIAPIILYDHPQIAPESAGNQFDSTEIDEILAMRIRTLTPEEKAEVRATAPQARQVLEHAELLDANELQRMHGRLRRNRPSELDESIHSPPPDSVCVGGSHVRAGDRVRLNPGGRNDIFDLALAGRIATVESIQQDFDGKLYVAVTADDDPGRDFGRMGLPGHRFFFRPDEVEPFGKMEPDEQ